MKLMKLLFALCLVALLVVSCSGCSALFQDSEGGFWDYFTGNTLRHDKAQWDADVRLASERTRDAEAAVDALRETLAIEQEKTEQLRLETELARAEADALDADVQLRALEGQLKIDKAVADTLNRGSRMHAILQFVLILFALFGVGAVLGVLYSHVRYKIRGY